ncbi:SDR family NAD(P)-dependent oxidoreductase [Arthrobacter sp. H14]|uniref:SDR family NAD(P)-dependent oxidoreductase n=1 Tax=Arthrobacter sp. H14 TaxID=1312959 RepID=UPI0004B76876|nr:SDR family NAD(P)-dependent oxidoreductase [Arthrobacter sp. H14]
MKIPPYKFEHGTAVLTGAAGGIGEQLAYGLARRGSALVLVDREAVGLAVVAETIRKRHPALSIDTHVVDLADAAAVTELTEDILKATPRISMLINNAGVALAGSFDQVGLDDFDWVMAINFHAPVLLTHALLPRILESRGSHIVNVSSLFGLVAPKGQTAYSASKFALRGFSEALTSELGPQGIGVTTVHPGGIRTNIARNARMSGLLSAAEQAMRKKNIERLLTFPPGKAAELILDAVQHRKRRLLIGANAKLTDVVVRLAPSSFGTFERTLGRADGYLRRRSGNRSAQGRSR